jgi:hypothetical protein
VREGRSPGETRQAGAVLEARKAQLVERDGGETGQGHLQREVVEQGDTEQRQGEQDEVDGDAGNHDRLWCENPGGCDWRCDEAHCAECTDESSCAHAAAVAHSQWPHETSLPIAGHIGFLSRPKSRGTERAAQLCWTSGISL